MSYTRKKPKTRKTLKKRRWKRSLKGRKTRYGGAFSTRIRSGVSSKDLSKGIGALGTFLSSKAASAASSLRPKKIVPEGDKAGTEVDKAPKIGSNRGDKEKFIKSGVKKTMSEAPLGASFLSSLSTKFPTVSMPTKFPEVTVTVPSFMKTKKPSNIKECDLQDLRKYIKSIKKVKDDDELLSVSTYILRTLNERVNKENDKYTPEGELIKYKDLIPDVMNNIIKGVIGRINALDKDESKGDALKIKIKPVLEDILKILYPKQPASNNGNLQTTQIEEDALNQDGIANAAKEKAARNAKNVSKRLAAETWKAKVKADYEAKSPEEKKATDDRLAAFQALNAKDTGFNNAEKPKKVVATIIDPSDANPASITTSVAGEVVGEVPRVKNQTNSQVANTNGQQVQSGLAVRESRETPTTDESGEVAITGRQFQSGLAARPLKNSNMDETEERFGGRRKKSSKVRQRNRR